MQNLDIYRNILQLVQISIPRISFIESINCKIDVWLLNAMYDTEIIIVTNCPKKSKRAQFNHEKSFENRLPVAIA